MKSFYLWFTLLFTLFRIELQGLYAQSAEDDQSEEILAWQKRQDQQLSTDDSFRLILDTFNDGRTAYMFATNPAAFRSDGLITVGQGVNFNGSWDGIWDVRTDVNPEGWVVELIIPFRTLNFNPDNPNWGINF